MEEGRGTSRLRLKTCNRDFGQGTYRPTRIGERDDRIPDGASSGPSSRGREGIRGTSRSAWLEPRRRSSRRRGASPLRRLARPALHRIPSRISSDSISVAEHDLRLGRTHVPYHADDLGSLDDLGGGPPRWGVSVDREWSPPGLRWSGLSTDRTRTCHRTQPTLLRAAVANTVMAPVD